MSEMVRSKVVWVGGIIGLLIGIVSACLFEAIGKSLIFLYPLGFFESNFNMNILEWVGVSPSFILLHIISWVLLGLMVGLIIYKIGKSKMKKAHIIFILIILLIGFLMLAFTFKVVYNNYLYNNLALPFIYIIGEILIIYGLYLLIKEKIKINEFFKLTKSKVISSLIIFIIISHILLDLWSYLPPGTFRCLAIGCEPIFNASRMLARSSLLFLILSYLLSCLIIFGYNKIRRKQQK